MIGRDVAESAKAMWALTALAAVACVLAALNIFLSSANRGLQIEANQRQQFINQTTQLSALNTQIINALAAAAAQTNDEAIRAMLAAQGITYTVNPTPGAAAPATPTAPAKP